jgi:hypothetical protein
MTFRQTATRATVPAASVALASITACSATDPNPGVPDVVGIWESIELPEQLQGRAEIDLVIADDGDWESRFIGPSAQVLYRGEGIWLDTDQPDTFVLRTAAAGDREPGRAVARVLRGGQRLRVETEQGDILYRRALDPNGNP